MSFSTMSLAIKQNVGRSTAKFVLLKLADNADFEGNSQIKFRSIMYFCDASLNSVLKSINYLQKKGFIKLVPMRKTFVAKNGSFCYNLTLKNKD